MKREEVLKDLEKTRDFGMKKYSKFHNDDEIAIQAININAWNIKYASDNLKGNKDLVMYCARRIPLSIGFASKELLNDLDVALVVAQEAPALMRRFGDKIQKIIDGKEPVVALKKAIAIRDIQEQCKHRPIEMRTNISI